MKKNSLLVKDDCERCTSAYNALKLLGMLKQDNIEIVNYSSMEKIAERSKIELVPKSHISFSMPDIELTEPDLPVLCLDGEIYSGVKLDIFLGSALGCWKWMKEKEIEEGTFNLDSIKRRMGE